MPGGGAIKQAAGSSRQVGLAEYRPPRWYGELALTDSPAIDTVRSAGGLNGESQITDLPS